MRDKVGNAANCRDDYDRNGYAVVKSAAPTEVVRAFLGLVSDGFSKPGVAKRFFRPPSVNAKSSYEFHSSQFPPLLGLHWGLTSKMCDISGKRLAPSYAYFRAYQKGDICTIHSDRLACDHSMSLAVAYADGIVWDFECGRRHYEYEDACKLKCANDFDDEDYSAVRLEPGDAIAYRGVNRRHGRMTPNPNRWSAHVFLHWVNLDGPYREWAFDKQLPPAPGDFTFSAI